MEVEIQRQVLISGLHTDVVLSHILPKFSWADIGSAACVNQAWQSSIKSTSPFAQCPLQDLAPVITMSSNGLCLSISDSITKENHLLPPIPEFGRFPMGSSFAFEKNVLYVLGGVHPLTGKFLLSVYAINMAESSKRWVKCPCMSSSRIGFGCIMLRDKIYVAGGEDENFLALDIVEVYDVKKKTWDVLPKLPMPRTVCLAAIHEDCLCIFVGGGHFLLEHIYKLKYGCRVWKFEEFTAEKVLGRCILQVGVCNMEAMNTGGHEYKMPPLTEYGSHEYRMPAITE